MYINPKANYVCFGSCITHQLSHLLRRRSGRPWLIAPSWSCSNSGSRRNAGNAGLVQGNHRGRFFLIVFSFIVFFANRLYGFENLLPLYVSFWSFLCASFCPCVFVFVVVVLYLFLCRYAKAWVSYEIFFLQTLKLISFYFSLSLLASFPSTFSFLLVHYILFLYLNVNPLDFLESHLKKLVAFYYILPR